MQPWQIVVVSDTGQTNNKVNGSIEFYYTLDTSLNVTVTFNNRTIPYIGNAQIMAGNTVFASINYKIDSYGGLTFEAEGLRTEIDVHNNLVPDVVASLDVANTIKLLSSNGWEILGIQQIKCLRFPSGAYLYTTTSMTVVDNITVQRIYNFNDLIIPRPESSTRQMARLYIYGEVIELDPNIYELYSAQQPTIKFRLVANPQSLQLVVNINSGDYQWISNIINIDGSTSYTVDNKDIWSLTNNQSQAMFELSKKQMFINTLMSMGSGLGGTMASGGANLAGGLIGLAREIYFKDERYKLEMKQIEMSPSALTVASGSSVAMIDNNVGYFWDWLEYINPTLQEFLDTYGYNVQMVVDTLPLDKMAVIGYIQGKAISMTGYTKRQHDLYNQQMGGLMYTKEK